MLVAKFHHNLLGATALIFQLALTVIASLNPCGLNHPGRSLNLPTLLSMFAAVAAITFCRSWPEWKQVRSQMLKHKIHILCLTNSPITTWCKYSWTASILSVWVKSLYGTQMHIKPLHHASSHKISSFTRASLHRCKIMINLTKRHTKQLPTRQLTVSTKQIFWENKIT
jgi:hypothetical protein